MRQPAGVKPQGVRLDWSDVPAGVRADIERVVGAAVVEAHNQPGGFSPGVAARCLLDDGRRCFLKTVSTAQNPDSPRAHRDEARIAAALPPDLGSPLLWHVVDDGDWVTLVFEDVDGVAPTQPWTVEELARVFAALDQLAERATPSPVRGLPTFGDRHHTSFRGFRELAGAQVTNSSLDRWTVQHLDRLAELEAEWEPASRGDTLVHSDVRADNLLVTRTGRIVLVDWPHACTGAPWLDKALLIPSVGLDGGPVTSGRRASARAVHRRRRRARRPDRRRVGRLLHASRPPARARRTADTSRLPGPTGRSGAGVAALASAALTTPPCRRPGRRSRRRRKLDARRARTSATIASVHSPRVGGV